MPARDWHVREMLFGFLQAVIGGYLLSATPNWSGRLPASGWRLAGLFGLWAICRLPFDLAASDNVAISVCLFSLDLCFPLTCTSLLLREARRRAPRQTWLAIFVFAGFGLCGAAYALNARLEGALLAPLAVSPPWVGIGFALFLIALVGGRLVPSLTRSALQPGLKDRVAPVDGSLDRLAIVGLPGAALVLAVGGQGLAAATAVLAVGFLHLWRLVRWRGWLLRSPEVLALHLAYGWLGVSLLLAGWSLMPGASIVPDAGLHAATVGAIGGMTMAVMGRLAMSRSLARGLPHVHQHRLFLLALVLLHLSALLRIAAAAGMGLSAFDRGPSLIAAAAAWSLAWTCLAVVLCLGALGGKGKQAGDRRG